MDKKSELKKLIESMISLVGSGHYASSMSALEIMYPLFYKEGVKLDEFILSKGHAVPALYAILYDKGYIKSLDGFRQYNGLPGHPSIETDGVLCSSGSLGMGISKALGLSLMNPNKTYHVLVGDGELQEGQNWEALLYMEANQVKNVIIHIDANGQQYSGEIRNGLEKFKFSGLNNNIIIHRTKWENDNSYLTKPSMPEYKKKVQEYSNWLLDIMSKSEKIIVLDADLANDFNLSGVMKFYPKRFIECGISEQHMVSMANGIARSGYYPICHTFGSFYRRCIDQIYNNYCDKLPVIYTAGAVGKLPLNIGVSHEATDGIDLLWWIPEILITDKLEDIELGKTVYYELKEG